MTKKYFAWTYGVARKPWPQIWWDEVDLTYASVRDKIIVHMELKGEDVGLSLDGAAQKYPAPEMAKND